MRTLICSTAWLAATSLVIVAALSVQATQFAAAQDDAELDGPIVEIAPSKDQPVETIEADETQNDGDAAQPSYWIGIMGRSIDNAVLRTQLQLAEDMGVVIEEVVPDSPAEKAGLRKHDIILRVNGDGVHAMTVMQDHVNRGQDKPLELKILRLGKELEVEVTPEPRPEDFEPRDRSNAWNGRALGAQPEALRRLLEQFEEGKGLPGGFRAFGPGVFLEGRRMDLNSMPGGMSVSIAREDDGPARITVKKDDKTWSFTEDDQEALDELPAEVRTFVERMLSGQGGGMGPMDLDEQLRQWIPDRLGNFDGPPRMGHRENELHDRMERMERRLEQLQKRLQQAEQPSGE